MDEDACGCTSVSSLDLPWHFRQDETVPGEGGRGEVIDAKRPPLCSSWVASEDVPAAVLIGQPVGLDVALNAPVGNSQPLAAATSLSQHGQHVEVDGGEGCSDFDLGDIERFDASAQSDRHHLGELGECGEESVLESWQRTGRRYPQRDHRGNRFFFVEEKRRKAVASREVVAAVTPSGGCTT